MSIIQNSISVTYTDPQLRILIEEFIEMQCI